MLTGQPTNITFTFDFNNGDENEMRILDYNSLIVYPEIPEMERAYLQRMGQQHHKHTRAQPHNHSTVDRFSKGMKTSSNAVLIVGIAVPFIVIVIVLIVVLVFVSLKKINDETEQRERILSLVNPHRSIYACS